MPGSCHHDTSPLVRHLRLRYWSHAMATIIAKPIVMSCVYDETPTRFNPLLKMVTNATPVATPTSPPRPPISDTPPRTTAATDCNEISAPRVGCPEATLAVNMSPPREANTEHIRYVERMVV